MKLVTINKLPEEFANLILRALYSEEDRLRQEIMRFEESGDWSLVEQYESELERTRVTSKHVELCVARRTA